MIKYLTEQRITSTWCKEAASGGLGWIYLEKNMIPDLPIIELIEMVERHNSFITINYGFYFGISHSRGCY